MMAEGQSLAMYLCPDGGIFVKKECKMACEIEAAGQPLTSRHIELSPAV
ncbi:hypothetical protein HanPSC8_Chr06g0237641 [Helianthus annuus]|nr:hypothetical protein HanPSC8_Chr06g0237641 [Helianthus annuus]